MATSKPSTLGLLVDQGIQLGTRSDRAGKTRDRDLLRGRSSEAQSYPRTMELAGYRVVLIGGSAGIGLETAADDVHLVINTALTGATYDIDGGQRFV
jgi:hypothetical protein